MGGFPVIEIATSWINGFRNRGNRNGDLAQLGRQGILLDTLAVTIQDSALLTIICSVEEMGADPLMGMIVPSEMNTLLRYLNDCIPALSIILSHATLTMGRIHFLTRSTPVMPINVARNPSLTHSPVRPRQTIVSLVPVANLRALLTQTR